MDPPVRRYEADCGTYRDDATAAVIFFPLDIEKDEAREAADEARRTMDRWSTAGDVTA